MMDIFFLNLTLLRQYEKEPVVFKNKADSFFEVYHLHFALGSTCSFEVKQGHKMQ